MEIISKRIEKKIIIVRGVSLSEWRQFQLGERDNSHIYTQSSDGIIIMIHNDNHNDSNDKNSNNDNNIDNSNHNNSIKSYNNKW